MKNIFITSIIALLFFQISLSNNPPSDRRPETDANVFGHIVDAETGEHLPFVQLQVKETRIGTITDGSGHYMLTNLPEGTHVLLARSMGYGQIEVGFEAVSGKTKELDLEMTPTSINLDEVTLTASPTASGFRYQPDAVFMGEQIQRKSEPSFGEMLNGQPGVAMRSLGSAPARPVIRGMDGDRILILENGERMGDISETSSDHSISLDPLAASRLEVIRGPASLLYGSSALGGVINLMTTDIPDKWDAGINGVISGQTATMNNMGAGFGRLTYGNERWATNARFAMREAGNITTPEGEIPGTSMKNYDGSVGVGVKRENLTGGLSLSLSDQNFGIPESIDDPTEEVEIRARRYALQGRFGRDLTGGFFDEAQLRFNVTKFEQQEVELELMPDAPVNENTALEYEQYGFSSTLTFQHKPVGILDRGAIGFNANGKYLDVIGDEVYTPGERRFSLATFTFQEIPMTNILRIQFGVRLDFQNTTALTSDRFPEELSRSQLNYSGSLGFNLRPDDWIEIGGQFARSHRNPLVEELFADGAHLGAGVYEVGNLNLEDEVGHGVDVFVIVEQPAFALELTTFVNDFSNYIIFEPTGQIHEPSGYPVFQYREGKAMLYGGEFSLSLDPGNGFSLKSGVDVVRGRRIIDNAPNENLPFIPPFRFNNAVEYDFEKGWIGASLQMVDKQDRVAPDEEVTEGYSLVGMQAGYRMNAAGRHVIIVRGENLFDIRYRDHLSRIEDRNFVMPGRNINLTYRWFF